ncbi:Neuron navigator 2 [Galemys pyrenaicus]|uniref:Neuron navigator 2 n=1 Tax=Galemys pyrenaicus TaxID=202257 RepID=A0A8J6E2J9_GALPY|nr:Neuron navigator 2 [Galemys pyrenaicus]
MESQIILEGQENLVGEMEVEESQQSGVRAEGQRAAQQLKLTFEASTPPQRFELDTPESVGLWTAGTRCRDRAMPISINVCVPTRGQSRDSCDQYKVIYTDWANHYLAKSGHKRLIKDLQQDVTDGVLLAQIIQVVANEKIEDINGCPKNRSQMIENIDACLNFLAAKGINIQGLSAEGECWVPCHPFRLLPVIPSGCSFRYCGQVAPAGASGHVVSLAGTIGIGRNPTVERRLLKGEREESKLGKRHHDYGGSFQRLSVTKHDLELTRVYAPVLEASALKRCPDLPFRELADLVFQHRRNGNLKAILGLFFSLSRYKQQQQQPPKQHLSSPLPPAVSQAAGTPSQCQTGTPQQQVPATPQAPCQPHQPAPHQQSKAQAEMQSRWGFLAN